MLMTPILPLTGGRGILGTMTGRSRHAINPADPPYSGDPTGERDSTEALRAAFADAAASGRTVLMTGTWRTSAALNVGGVQITGSGDSPA